MDLFSENLNFQKKNIIYSSYDGVDCFAVNEVIKYFDKILIILRDDTRLSRFSNSLKIINNDLNILEFPAWDCLPFDRNSPNQKLIGKRVNTLFNLINLDNSKTIILTTIGSVIQKIPPKSFIINSSLKIEIGKKISQQQLILFFESNGYMRSNTVREDTEYSVRGSIVDVYPPGDEFPIRIDFFGDEIETIRTFDPLNQLSLNNVKEVKFYPGNELILNEKSINLFRRRYRENFSNQNFDEYSYQQISEKNIFNGMEHLLPLFHDELVSIFDYLDDCSIVFDKDFQLTLESKLEDIQDFYNSRKENNNSKSIGYNLLPSNQLYFNFDDLISFFKTRKIIELNSNTNPLEVNNNYFNINAKPGINFSSSRVKGENPIKELINLLKVHRKILITCNSKSSLDRIVKLINYSDENALRIPIISNPLNSEFNFSCMVYPLEKGFKLNDKLFVTEEDLFGVKFGRPPPKSKKADEFLRDITSLSTGDFLVHVEHGIGRYEGLETLQSSDVERDCLKLIYSGGDKLYLPVENIELISRYGSGSDANLDKLGSSNWQARKANAKKRIKEIADQLIKIAAIRKTSKVKPLDFSDDEYGRFCSRFPYSPTEDQLIAIQDVENDLKSGKLMDRLICGDVGYGKTEVALRASFMASMSGFQVALIAPTTLLVKQHVESFKERFKGFPIKINELSRFIKPKQGKIVKDEIQSGETQIIIGTHSLLSKKIKFNNLSLIIIDEEQHFGVSQKEYLKSLRGTIHVLTLTATPIPRTLQMSLTGVRSMSLITTPPVDRLSVRTFVSTWDGVTIKDAVKREIHRGGVTFCVVPRIKDLPRLYDMIKSLMPEIKIATAHGKMKVEDIDESMISFSEGKVNVLLSTNIIESGLDIPSANTLIIYGSDKFGLSQLYQMRGRVGRGRVRAYAYLTTAENTLISSDARKRLEVMQTLDNLGAGFSLASYDMDIRGAGNLLGEEQSGHIKEVGIELYQSLLKSAVEIETIGSAQDNIEWSPQIQIGVTSKIPENYINDISVRLSIYRRLAYLKTDEEIEDFKFELNDRFGLIPKEVDALLETIKIKQLCKISNINKVDVGNNGITLCFFQNKFSNPEKLIEFISLNSTKINVKPDQSIVIFKDLSNKENRVESVKEELKTIGELVH